MNPRLSAVHDSVALLFPQLRPGLRDSHALWRTHPQLASVIPLMSDPGRARAAAWMPVFSG